MSADTGGQAFPVPLTADGLGGMLQGYDGMTLRDYFATNALPVAADTVANGCGNYAVLVAESAYEIADAMLRERAK